MCSGICMKSTKVNLTGKVTATSGGLLNYAVTTTCMLLYALVRLTMVKCGMEAYPIGCWASLLLSAPMIVLICFMHGGCTTKLVNNCRGYISRMVDLLLAF